MKRLLALILFSLAAFLVAGSSRAAIPISDLRGQVKTQIDGLRSDCIKKLEATKPGTPEHDAVIKEFNDGAAQIRGNASKGDTRYEEITGIIKDQNIPLSNTGSRPKNVTSDMDFTASDYSGITKIKAALKGKATVIEQGDRLIIPEWDCTIWKPRPANVVGSSAHTAEMERIAAAEDVFPTQGGLYQTSDGKIGHFDPEGAVLANGKKFMEALPNGDLHVIAKSTYKAAEWSGTAGADPKLMEQALALKNHQTPEEAGIVELGDSPAVKAQKIQDFIQRCRASMSRSYEAGVINSVKLQADIQKQITEAEAAGKGNDPETIALRQRIIETSASNEATLGFLARTNPELAGQLIGRPVRIEADGTLIEIATGRRFTKSGFIEEILAPYRAAVVKTIRGGGKSKEAPVAEPKVPGGRVTAFGKTVVKGLGVAVMAVGAYDAIHAGVEQAVNEELNGDSTLKTVGKATAYSIWNFLGVPGAVQVGKEEANASVDQYFKDLKAGKDPSKLWAVARAGGNAAGRMLYEATIGSVKGLYDRALSYATEDPAYLKQCEEQIAEMRRKIEDLKKKLEIGARMLAEISAEMNPAALDPADIDRSHTFRARLAKVPHWVKSVKVQWQGAGEELGTENLSAASPGEYKSAKDLRFDKPGPAEVWAVFSVEGPYGLAYDNALLCKVNAKAVAEITLEYRTYVADRPGTMDFRANVKGVTGKYMTVWDFGDRSSAATLHDSASTTHNYSSNGRYTLSVLLLENGTGKQLARDSALVDISPPATHAATEPIKPPPPNLGKWRQTGVDIVKQNAKYDHSGVWGDSENAIADGTASTKWNFERDPAPTYKHVTQHCVSNAYWTSPPKEIAAEKSFKTTFKVDLSVDCFPEPDVAVGGAIGFDTHYIAGTKGPGHFDTYGHEGVGALCSAKDKKFQNSASKDLTFYFPHGEKGDKLDILVKVYTHGKGEITYHYEWVP